MWATLLTSRQRPDGTFPQVRATLDECLGTGWDPRSADAMLLSEWILISCLCLGHFGEVPYPQCSRILLVLGSFPMYLILS